MVFCNDTFSCVLGNVYARFESLAHAFHFSTASTFESAVQQTATNVALLS